MNGVGPLLALTGGSGFVGRAFRPAVRRAGWRIRHLGRRPPPDADPADEWGFLDLAAVEDADLSGCAALVHLAAHIPTDHGDPAEAERCWRINALGTLRLVDAAIRAGVGRIMQASSANAYAPTGQPPDERAPLFPGSRGYYLGSKVCQEIYAAERCREEDVLLQTLRLASVYGPGQRSGALAAMAQAAASGGPIRVRGGGGFGADLIHVDDVARAMLLLLGSENAGAFNVGSGVRTTIAELAQLLAERTGAPVVHDDGEGGEDWGFPALNIDRLRALGYRPMRLADGLKL
ncbi:NAD(P)-dependent oxidoreductase [Sphingobium indicum]|uniref:Epimerase n=2 Tax=Sphingobium indicum TaxID=332055 RepID=A0A1L5BSN9_SPHIB|nr:NAD(P)-dependent oxidoreductase [Sphingobium indicum]APL95894.1 epimerase [Sphingobium indicum B90A]NYI22687.1 UDP-glucose 4-epimerase [Sphingobium indicum]RYM02339.1 NAD(P)-dependent oxidoreductase [Sphingobium indicum]